MARIVADLPEVVGIDHVVTVDPHTAQIERLFHAPVAGLWRDWRAIGSSTI
jgi:phosphoribosylpyrophosphate synthetase